MSLLAENTFVSGACDFTSKLWDIRTGQATATLGGHNGDINSVQAFPTGLGFATASDDSTIKFWDIRMQGCLQKFESSNCGITSVAFSRTGRYIFGGSLAVLFSNGNFLSGYDNYSAMMFDVLFGKSLSTLQAHDNRVSCLGVPQDGLVLCTGSWDSFLKVVWLILNCLDAMILLPDRFG